MKTRTKEGLILTTIAIIVASSMVFMFYVGYKYGETFGFTKGQKVGYEAAWNRIMEDQVLQFELELDKKEGEQK